MKSFERAPQPEKNDQQESREAPGEYLYHMVPPGQRGDTLMPLNDLHDVYPEVYDRMVEKYSDRGGLRELQIPTLGARWNEVLHLTAVHPEMLQEALKDAGARVGMMQWYQVPKTALRADSTVVYRDNPLQKGIAHDDIVPYNESEIEKYAHLPQFTKEYYAQEVSAGRQPLLFHGVPHILYKGTLDTTLLKKIVT